MANTARYPVDLHAHSTCSDGTLRPAAVVELAGASGVRIFALTDHDTLAGIPEATEAARRHGMRLVPGIEISAWETREVHILGYFVDPAEPRLVETMRARTIGRIARVEEICRRLAALGAPVDPAAILASADGNVGRPHVARALLQAGHAATFDEAFKRYLGRDAPAYVAQERLEATDAIRLIHQAGGAAVLAHPGVEDLDAAIPRLAAAGLDGLEVVHPSHDDAAQRRYGRMARDLGLCATGGADFHGPHSPHPPGSYGIWPDGLAALEMRRGR